MPRGTDGTIDQLPAVASELVGLKVDVIVALATPAGRAAQHATSTIPIVVGSMGDPVQDGLVASLSRPGGNITGTTFLGPELVPKRLALLKELMPALSEVAVLWHPGAFSEQTTSAMMKQVTDTAGGLGLKLQLVEVHRPDEFERHCRTWRKGTPMRCSSFRAPCSFRREGVWLTLRQNTGCPRCIMPRSLSSRRPHCLRGKRPRT